MPWFMLGGDARLGQCATDNCGGQPTWRFEGSGIGSNYCPGCRERIRSTPPSDGISMEQAAAESFGLNFEDLDEEDGDA